MPRIRLVEIGSLPLLNIFSRSIRRANSAGQSTRIQLAMYLLGGGSFEYWGRLSDEHHVAQRNVSLQETWLDRGHMQFEFLKSIGLKPHHQFLDYGAAQLATARHVVPYLDFGKYVGVDVGKVILSRGVDRLTDLGIERSRYHIIPASSPDLIELNGFTFDFIFSFSALQYMNGEDLHRVLERFLQMGSADVRICLTYSRPETRAEALSKGMHYYDLAYYQDQLKAFDCRIEHIPFAPDRITPIAVFSRKP